MTDTADLADYVLPATTQLEHLDVHTELRPHLRADQRAGDRAARRGQAEHADLSARSRRRMGFDDAVLRRRATKTLARIAFKPAARSASTSTPLRATAGVKLPIAEAPFADGGFPTPSGKCLIDAPGLGVPDHVPNYESAASTPELAARFPLAMISPPARNFLNSSFVNVTSLRDIEGEPVLEIACRRRRARAASPSGRWCAIFNDRGELPCARRSSGARARPGVVNGLGVWWRKLGARRHATSTS